MVAATLQTESAVNAALPDLPPGTRFGVRRIYPTVFPVLGFALVAHARSGQLEGYLRFQFAPLLSSVQGVASVSVLGGQDGYPDRPTRPGCKRWACQSRTWPCALSSNNVVVATGRLEDRYRLYLVLADNRLTGGDIGRTIIQTGSRGVIELDDIARVVISDVPGWTRVTSQGRDAVLLNVRQTPDANSVALVREKRQRIADASGDIFPPDIQFVTYYDQSQLVTAAAISVRDAILLGAFLAGIVLFVFLRSPRFMLIVALLLPAVLAATSLVPVLGLSFNMMTLGWKHGRRRRPGG